MINRQTGVCWNGHESQDTCLLKNEKTNKVHLNEKMTIELGIAHSSKIGNITTTTITIVRTINSYFVISLDQVKC